MTDSSPSAFRPSPLPSDLRNQLERVVVEARDVAEVGARAALEALAVHHHEPYPHMKPPARRLRNQLRARARQLGDRQDAAGRMDIAHLVAECAYEHWHRMLFARFLAENNLLIEPEENMAISLEEAEELAKEEGVDVWTFASRCAQGMLPQIFRPDDPLLAVSLATEHRIKLEQLLAGLPAAVFTASDALGWCYQFWQSKKKDEVNRSEVKIGADEIAAVTQLFTEPYMVEFLLHNTLGAWWAGKKLKDEGGRMKEEWEKCQSEADCRRLLSLPGVTWDYLRFVKVEAASCRLEDTRQDAASTCRPAAGTFDGWPEAAKDIKVLDPCCGSGHFLVAALHHLVPIRMAEEGLSVAEAVDAVLRDNLHGLEIDERCCQIAAFAVALAAWTYPGAGGYRELPELHIACTGIGPQCSAEEWIKLAEESGIPMPRLGREPIKEGLLNLHRLFSQAPTLGSLINPAELPRDLIAADYETIQPYLTAIHDAEKADDETRERAVAAAGMVKSADLLAGDYTLVITNVPYLGRGKQDSVLQAWADEHEPDAKADLATIFISRCFKFLDKASTLAVVSPQNWLFLTSYKKLRERLLRDETWNVVARLGPGAFETISGHVVNVALLILSGGEPAADHAMLGIDVSAPRGQPPIYAAEKSARLRDQTDVRLLPQAAQRKNPDARILFDTTARGTLLADYAQSYEGMTAGDLNRYVIQFWECKVGRAVWTPFAGASEVGCYYGARDQIIRWHSGNGPMQSDPCVGIKGREAWNHRGVRIHQTGSLACSLYDGDIFDKNGASVVPKSKDHLPAIFAFCSSEEFRAAVRAIDQALKVTIGSMVKVPFDLAHWQKVAAEKYPHGLPEPQSNDPTQWLFHGHPAGMVAAGPADRSPIGLADPVGAERHPSLICRAPNLKDVLQVAVARLLGYRWPAEVDAASSRVKPSGFATRPEVASTGASVEFQYFDPDEPIANLAGNLPHWRQDGVVYFVTFRTADSIPQEKLRQWQAEREAWLAAHPPPHDAATRREYFERFPKRIEKWLDAGYGECLLAREDCRAIVEEALWHFDGERYHLDEFTVMPNHVHVLVVPLAGHDLSSILHSWKSYTAKRINRLLGRAGEFWQKESFDHIVRNAEQMERLRQYIRDNPGLFGELDPASGGLEEDRNARPEAAATMDTMRLDEASRAWVERCAELLPFADSDGIVCIPSVRGEDPAAERLRRLLAAAFGEKWSPELEQTLIRQTGSTAADLDEWLRNDFFEQHCKLFHDRPFVWHIWDGRKRDGFHALVNYHRLCGSGFQPLSNDTRQDAASTGRRLLESLTYAYLGDWIVRQKDGVKRGEEGAEDRLAAALELQKRLEAILEGEPPFDIFVRWKPLSEQPIGWEPDINDGVRINIRPFMASDLPGGKKGAGILRAKPNIKWGKDRGKEPERPKAEYPWFWGWDEKAVDFAGGKKFDGNRWNSCHYTNHAKQTARESAGKGNP